MRVKVAEGKAEQIDGSGYLGSVLAKTQASEQEFTTRKPIEKEGKLDLFSAAE